MRRYLPLLFMSFLIVVVAIAGTLLASQASRQNPSYVSSITVYTSLPVEQAAALAQEYEKTAGVRVNVVPLTAGELVAKLRQEAAGPRADLVLASADTLDAAKKANLLTVFSSAQTDIVPARFCDTDDYWTGLWYDPVVFAANRDFLKKLPQPPSNWAELTTTGNARLVMIDFLVAEEAANLLFTLAAAQGEDQTLAYLAGLHPRVVQYAKFLATPARMTSLGEADIAITMRSDAMRYIKDGFPLQIILPADGTAVSVTGAGLASGSSRTADAGLFLDWLTGDAAQAVLAKNGGYFLPANPESRLAMEGNGKDLP
ncbi:MAG TPA: extracellular solute-binding protein, partial [Negativicutes bacterium]|nr:extracellular solute-binding protein [Negativicutes bacterium]